MAHQVAPQASADLDNISYYVANDSGSSEIADQVIDSITAWLFLLGGQPYLGRPRDDDFGIGLRSFPVGEYVIVYLVEDEDKDVLILRVVHGRRDMEELFG